MKCRHSHLNTCWYYDVVCNGYDRQDRDECKRDAQNQAKAKEE